LAIHIPVYVDGGRTLIEMSWQKDLLLARDWLARPFGQLTLLCPSLPLHVSNVERRRLVSIGENEGVRVVPSFDVRCRTREFWLKQRRQWMRDVRRELKCAKVIHCSADGVYRPLWYLAHMAAVKKGITTVLVGPDMDPHLTEPSNLKGSLVCKTFDLLMKRAALHADLVLLKEGAVHTRYAPFAQNTKGFCQSMHRTEDVIQEDCLEERLTTLKHNRPLRAIYAGRFVRRKGLHDAICAIACAKKKGVMVEYHLFGSGPEESALKRQAAELGVSSLVQFHGFVEYGPGFIKELGRYDLLLFLPTEEDTPRMLYDAMAAGLPLVGSRISFLQHRVETDGIGILVGVGDSSVAGDELCRLSAERAKLTAFSRAAAAAGLRHSIEHWYRLRAAWTQEAAQREPPAIQAVAAMSQARP